MCDIFLFVYIIRDENALNSAVSYNTVGTLRFVAVESGGKYDF